MGTTLDACLLQQEINEDIFKNYCKIFSAKIINLIEEYWNNNFSELSNQQILEFVLLIHNIYEYLDNFGVSDINFKKNATEMMMVFNKKFFWDSMNSIKQILKQEREKKVERLSNKNFITIGPNLIFKGIFEAYDLVKSLENKMILENILEYTKYILVQYLMGLDTTIRVNLLLIKNKK